GEVWDQVRKKRRVLFIPPDTLSYKDGASTNDEQTQNGQGGPLCTKARGRQFRIFAVFSLSFMCRIISRARRGFDGRLRRRNGGRSDGGIRRRNRLSYDWNFIHCQLGIVRVKTAEFIEEVSAVRAPVISRSG